MAKCDRCGAQESMPYNCRLCGGTYCAEHRLPENHNCPGLDDWGDPDGVFDSGFDDSVRHRGGRDDEGLLEGLSLSTGPGGPLAYFRGNMTFVFLALMWLTFLGQFVVRLTLGVQTEWAIFALQPEHLTYVWTWVTSVFAHGGFFHIATNSIVLYFFGPVVEARTGSKRFAALFLASGAIAGLSQAVATILTNGVPLPIVGASGAIMAVMGVLTVLNPNLRVYLYFILPMPLWVLTIGFALFSVLFILSPGGGALGGIAHWAHLSGLVIGLLYGARLKREGRQAPQQLQFGGGRGGPPGPGGPGRGRF